MTTEIASQPRKATQWVYAGLWLLVVALFVGIRVSSFIRMGNSIYGRHVLLDSEWYYEQALRVSHGQLQEKLAYFFGPGWPVLLGTFYGLTGTESIAAGRFLNTVLSAITLLCLAWSGKQIGGKWLALAVGAAWSLYGLAALYEQTLLLETSAACALSVLIVVWLWACNQVSSRAVGLPEYGVMLVGTGVGIAIGVAALFRANVIGVLPILTPAFGWVVLQRSEGPTGRRLARVLGGCVAVVLGTLISIAPATWHNYRAEHVLIPISSNFGINIWVGLGPTANGRYVVPPSTNNNADPRGAVAVRQKLGRELNSAELSSYWMRETLASVTFSRVTSLTWTKLRLLFQRHETPQIYTPDEMESENLTTRLPVVEGAHFMTFLFLGIVVLALRRTPKEIGISLGALAIVASLLPFFVTDRYKLAASPWFLLVSMAGVQELIRLLVAGAWKRGLAVSLCIVPGCIGWLWPVALPDVKLLHLRQRATLEAKERDFEPSLRMIREYNIVQPDGFSLSLEASILEEYKHDYVAAAGLYERAIPLMPLSASLRFNAAQAELRANRKEMAHANLKEALRLEPSLPASAWYNLALLDEQAGDFSGAKGAAQNAAKAEPGNELYIRLARRLAN